MWFWLALFVIVIVALTGSLWKDRGKKPRDAPARSSQKGFAALRKRLTDSCVLGTF
jgi:hypothetical protein